MGTRADFYIGRGNDAEWLGSVAWDGYEWEDGRSALRRAKTPEAFRKAVEKISKERDDLTSHADGWPWPWEDSRTTDYAYVLHQGKVTIYIFGHEVLGKESRDEKVDWFPNMSSRANVTFGERSGLIVITG